MKSPDYDAWRWKLLPEVKRSQFLLTEKESSLEEKDCHNSICSKMKNTCKKLFRLRQLPTEPGLHALQVPLTEWYPDWKPIQSRVMKTTPPIALILLPCMTLHNIHWLVLYRDTYRFADGRNFYSDFSRTPIAVWSQSWQLALRTSLFLISISKSDERMDILNLHSQETTDREFSKFDPDQLSEPRI